MAVSVDIEKKLHGFTLKVKLDPHIKLITVHMDAIDHCQTTRAILRNEARHHGTDMSRLIIPEDGESITLK